MAKSVHKRPYPIAPDRSSALAVDEGACATLYGVTFRRSMLLLSIVACGEPSAPALTGIDLTIAWDSTMGVDRLVVWATAADGTSRLEQQMLPAPYSVDPPGL